MCFAHQLTSLPLVNVIELKGEAKSFHVDYCSQTEPFAWFRLLSSCELSQPRHWK
jgi:hypothetical protein